MNETYKAKFAMITAMSAGCSLRVLLLVAAASSWPTPELLTGPGGTRFGLVLEGPAPVPGVLVALTGAMADTLGCNATGTSDPCYYANGCQFLVPRGWACASLDLPSHGAERLPGEPEGIAGWRWRTDKGIDFVAQNNRRVTDLLAELARRNITTAGSKLAVSGISRGGFMAAQLALHLKPKLIPLGMLSPVTNLSLLSEFQTQPADSPGGRLVRSLDLFSRASELVEHNIWAIIGDQDVRVFTDSCVRLLRTIQCSGCAKTAWGCSACPTRTAVTQLKVEYEPKGHTVPPSSQGGRSTFQALADWLVGL